MATRTRRTKSATAAPAPEVVIAPVSKFERFLQSDLGRKLSRPMSEAEKRTAVSAGLTGGAIAITGPIAGPLIAVAATTVDTNATKDNWNGIIGTAAAGLAGAVAGAGAVAAAGLGLLTTGTGMLFNRLNSKD